MNACDKHIDCSRGISLRPLARCIVVLLPVALVQISDFGHERVVRVGIGEEGADREKHFRDGEGGRPLVLEDVQANRAIAVDVSMVNFRCERNLGRLEGIVGREMDVQEKDTPGVRRVIWSHDGCLPVELVLFVGGAS